MKPLNEMFDVTYGNKFDLNKMKVVDGASSGDWVNFVGRSSGNHGVSARVRPVAGAAPFEAGLITVALGGTKLLASFVQMRPFYTAQNVAVLRPQAKLSFAEKLFICLAIRHNRFRYSAFGREANRTLRTLLIPEPEEFPKWVQDQDTSVLETDFANVEEQPQAPMYTGGWKSFLLSDLFDIKKGKRLTKANMQPGPIPFISAIDSNNGLRQRVKVAPLHPANVITVNYNGNGVADAYFQREPFWASDDVNILYPKFSVDLPVALFICTIIRREKYRFSYGRKWGLERMKASAIKLPAVPNGQPDWNLTAICERSTPRVSAIVTGVFVRPSKFLCRMGFLCKAGISGGTQH
ncbi:MAG: restriction endonuclease subunit S [Methylocella sp.]|nr:MAG: hypothetical protein DLM68_06585 [Hyphomicrobiales bacterium]